MTIEKCTNCGSRQIGQGKFNGYANISVCNEKGRETLRSSPVAAEVCANCGLVLSLRVTQPEKFLPKIV